MLRLRKAHVQRRCELPDLRFCNDRVRAAMCTDDVHKVHLAFLSPPLGPLV
jgi:hypothetical protein